MSAMNLPPVTPAPVPTQLTAATAPGAGHATGPGSFSQLLEAADARRQAEAPAPAPENRPDNAATSKRAAAPAQKSPPREDRKTDRTTTSTTTATGAAAASDEHTADRSVAGMAAEDAAADTATAPTDAASLLAGLGLVQRVLAPAESAGALGRAGHGGAGRQAPDGSLEGPQDGAAGRTAAAGGAGAAGGARAAGAASGAGAAGAAGAAAGADLKADNLAARGGAGPSFAELLAAAQGADASAAPTELRALAEAPVAAQADGRPVEATLLGALVGQGAAATTGAAAGSSAAHPAEARLGTTPGQAGFAEQLGAQLSTFVREGVQHARLQLHPLELGPVTVQIHLEGGSAHMSFAAEHAQTRQALEQALPTLAGSLREAGLTLSGGGVFEQHRQPQPDAGTGRGDGGDRQGARGGKGSSDDSGPLQAAAGPAQRRRGVVDLVA